MPQLIDHIDLIARRKGRDVLYLDFRDAVPGERWAEVFIPVPDEWEDLPARRDIIAWLDAEGIHWKPCCQCAARNGNTNYIGQIYLDVPFDTTDSTYQKLAAHLENPDGSPRLAGVTFAYLPLDKAMENADHDEPGFWDREDW